MFFSCAVAINQSKRLRAKGRLTEGSFRGGSSAVGGEGVPLLKQKLLSCKRGRAQRAPTKIVRRSRSFEVMPKASLLLRARSGARSAPLRGLAVFYSCAVAINQSKRLHKKGHLAEAPSEEGAKVYTHRNHHGYALISRAHQPLPPSVEGGGPRSGGRRVSKESNFTFEKSQRLLRRSRHVVRVLSVSLCCTSKTSQQLFRQKRVFGYKA